LILENLGVEMHKCSVALDQEEKDQEEELDFLGLVQRATLGFFDLNDFDNIENEYEAHEQFEYVLDDACQ